MSPWAQPALSNVTLSLSKGGVMLPIKRKRVLPVPVHIAHRYTAEIAYLPDNRQPQSYAIRLRARFAKAAKQLLGVERITITGITDLHQALPHRHGYNTPAGSVFDGIAEKIVEQGIGQQRVYRQR